MINSLSITIAREATMYRRRTERGRRGSVHWTLNANANVRVFPVSNPETPTFNIPLENRENAIASIQLSTGLKHRFLEHPSTDKLC